MGPEPLSDKMLLTRRAVSELLTRAGHPITPGYLQVLATRGQGPRITYIQRMPLYQMGHVRQFLEARIGMSVHDGVAAGLLIMHPEDAAPKDARKSG